MIRFIVYKKNDGKIECNGFCPEDQYEKQAPGPDAEIMVFDWSVSGRVNHVIDGVPVWIDPPPPPEPTPEELAMREEIRFHQDVLSVMAKGFFNHENRVRVLEGKAVITWEQFKTAIRGMM